jgi:hypothetical protein
MKIARRILLALIVVFGLIQVVPYGRDHVNPPVRREPSWNSPETRSLAQRACFDCHSNETRWPGYANIAPASWLVQHDVNEGREVLNFSEWDRPQKEAGDSAKEVQEGEMPPSYYVLLHPEARLNQSEREALIAGLRATVNLNSSGEGTR